MRWWVVAAAATVGLAPAAAKRAPAPPTAGLIAVPADWQPIALAAPVASAPGEVAQAWGDPGRGCYASVVVRTAPRQGVEDALVELRQHLATHVGLEGEEVSAVAATVRGRIVRGSLRGEVRAAVLGRGAGVAVAVAACAYNSREPAACAARCQPVLASFDVAKVVP
ncbi:MAG: hypothetical protein R3B06_00470 [Kofleriaceae bacterium]